MTQEALKLALEALESKYIVNCGAWRVQQNQAIAAIKEALAQPEQEPVAWGVDWGKAGDIPCVSIIKRLPKGGIEVMAVEYAPYSYTTPPQRTWVGLTDEEFNELDKEDLSLRQFVQAIDDRLKDKNNAT